MKSTTASNDFRDALVFSRLSFAEAAEVLDRSLFSVQSYASGKRPAPPELVAHLCTHAWDALYTDDDRDRHGRAFTANSLAMRRAMKNPAIYSEFERLKEAMARNPQPDPDATVNLGPEPDQTYDDHFGEDDDPYDRSLDDGEDR